MVYVTGTRPAADWKRPPRGPQKTLLQQTEEDTGMTTGTSQLASLDCSLWRSLRPSAGQAQQ